MWMLIPSSPHADELLRPKAIARSSPGESGDSWSAQAPTRGRRQATSGTSPSPVISPVMRGPTLTKQVFRSSAEIVRIVRCCLLAEAKGLVIFPH